MSNERNAFRAGYERMYDTCPRGYIVETGEYTNDHAAAAWLWFQNGAAWQRTQAQPADKLADALKELLECPFNVDDATVPRAGIEAAPEQVVLEVSVDLLRWRKAREALDAHRAAQEKK